MKLAQLAAIAERIVEILTYFIGMVLIGLAIAGGLWIAHEKGLLGPVIAALFIVGALTGRKTK